MAGWKAGGILWTVFLNLLKQNNLGRVLAEPNLVTTSGQKASFLAGGQYPYPVPQASGGGTTITIQFQQYGVQLEFTPTVLDDNKIAIKVHPTVSELDYTNAVSTGGFVVPGLLSREMNTQVEVRDGQTFSIAGLLSDTVPECHQQVPGAGGYPRPGGPVPLHQLPEERNGAGGPGHLPPGEAHTAGRGQLPTDKWIDPTDVDVYLLGREQGQQQPVPKPTPPAAATTGVR